jgi:ABC-type lipoprotein release transport system permease subunit
MVNEYLAHRVWGSAEAAIGRSFRAGADACRVVGVVENGKYSSLLEPPRPFVFARPSPAAQAGTVLVETAGPPSAFADAIRQAIRREAPHCSMTSFITLRRHMDLAYFAYQTAAGLLGTVALLGVFLAGVGLFGLVAYSVNRRTHEFGVRMALGAEPRTVLRMVVRQSLAPLAAGAVIGWLGAVAGARVLGSVLYEVQPADPLGSLAGTAIVAAVALAAASIPARRTLHIDPMTALRQT